MRPERPGRSVAGSLQGSWLLTGYSNRYLLTRSVRGSSDSAREDSWGQMLKQLVTEIPCMSQLPHKYLTGKGY